jgi:phenylacetate-CoA ligase
VVRGLGGVAEYRVDLRRSGALLEIEVTVEPLPGAGEGAAVARRLEDAFRSAFQMRIPVVAVEPGSLPRFELKARRWHRHGDSVAKLTPSPQR